MSTLTLADIDRDDAITDALDRLHGTTRAGFLRRAALGGAALLAASAAPAEARPGRRDEATLNYALTLEYCAGLVLQRGRATRQPLRQLAEQCARHRRHERAHVVALRGARAGPVGQAPRFDFRGATEDPARFRRPRFASRSCRRRVQGPGSADPDRAYLVPALAIHAVEARHAAWIRLRRHPAAEDESRRASLQTQHARDRRRHSLRGCRPAAGGAAFTG